MSSVEELEQKIARVDKLRLQIEGIKKTRLERIKLNPEPYDTSTLLQEIERLLDWTTQEMNNRLKDAQELLELRKLIGELDGVDQ